MFKKLEREENNIDKMNDLRKAYAKKEISQQEYHASMNTIRSKMIPEEVAYEKSMEALRDKRRNNEITMIEYREQMKSIVRIFREGEDKRNAHKDEGIDKLLEGLIGGTEPESLSELSDTLVQAGKLIKMITGEAEIDNTLISDLFMKIFQEWMDTQEDVILPFNVHRMEIRSLANDDGTGTAYFHVSCKLCMNNIELALTGSQQQDMEVIVVKMMIAFISEHLEEEHIENHVEPEEPSSE